jgi:hypothetical protein
MVRATYNGVARIWNKYDERQVRRKIMAGSKEIDLPLGDGNANVAVTKGFKSWASSQSGGLTIESTVVVNLTCGQTEPEIREANENAGILAESMAREGFDEMKMYLDGFDNPEPRRSEHPKHRRKR